MGCFCASVRSPIISCPRFLFFHRPRPLPSRPFASRRSLCCCCGSGTTFSLGLHLPSRASLQWPTWTVSEAAQFRWRLFFSFSALALQLDPPLSSSRYANVVLSSLLDLGFATGHYFLLMLCSFTNKVLARLDLLSCVNGWFQVASIGTAVSMQTSLLHQRAISTTSIWSTWRC